MKYLPQEVVDDLYKNTNIRPCYLIEIELEEEMHLSTGVEYTLDDKTYITGRVQGLRMTSEQVTFGIVNEEYQYTTPALLGSYQRAPVKVYWFNGMPQPHLLIDEGYVEEGYYDTDNRPEPILLFDGNVSRFTQITTILGVEATRSAARRYPSLRVLPPIADFVAPEGTQIRLGNNIFRLEPRSD